MSDHFYIRPVRAQDIDNLYTLVRSIRDGIASLPCDRQMLAKRIELSESSFAKAVDKLTGKEYYMFVLINEAKGKIVGVSAIYGRSGGQPSFQVYQIKHEKFSHAPLGVEKAVDALHLRNVEPGLSELCSLYMHENYRKQGLAPLLTFSRYMYIARNKGRFSSRLMANLRGARNDQGRSPFWLALGKHFFGGRLATIDTLKSLGKKKVIRDLMPRHPIYIPLLPEEARKAIGKTHHNTLGAQKLLEKQGFKFNDWVDILDAGPFFVSKIKDIKLVKNLKSGKISCALDHKPESAKRYLLATHGEEFRSCIAAMTVDKVGNLCVEGGVLERLGVQVGAKIDYVQL